MRNSEQKRHFLIVGGGPAGLAAAISGARAGLRTTLCEQLDRPGVKLAATGGGRGNLTSLVSDASFMAVFGRQGRFMAPALARLNPAGLRVWLADCGVRTFSPDGVRVYPEGESAAAVARALRRAAEETGVLLRTGTRAAGLWIEQGALRGVVTSGERIAAHAVLVATGGLSYPALGATGDGYTLARQAGHTVVAPLPALAPILTRETWPASCAGVSLPDVRLRLELPGRAGRATAGALLFTHTGISGPAALDLSGDVAAALARGTPAPLRLELVPGRDRESWRSRFTDWTREHGKKRIVNLLAETLPASLAHALCGLAGLAPEAVAAQFPAPARLALEESLTALPLTATGTGGFDVAIVTRGGVSLREVDPHTLESRLLPGLFFAGEVLDLDGPCGGYNLTWAFASGALAAQGIADGRLAIAD